MANILNMLKVGKTFEGAEKIALDLIRSGKKDTILDLQLLYAAQGKSDLVQQWEAIADKCLPLSPRRAFNKAYFFLKNGDLKTAMDYLYISRQEKFFGSPEPKTMAELWDGNKELKNKKVILYCERGLGDEIINVRFAKNLKDLGAKTIVACQPSLAGLFSNIDFIDCVVPNTIINLIYADYWVPAMSAPKFLNLTYDTLDNKPYLSIKKNKAWEYIFDKKYFNVGIRWAGNPKYENEQFRRFPVELMLKLSNIKGVKLYSLQRDDDMFNLPNEIVDLSHLIQRWEDTANAIDCLDLVITSCTSVAHCSAAMGRPTWIIVPIMPYYIWSRNENDWYDSVKLYRQTKFGFWDDVFEKVYLDLERKIAK